MKNNIKIVHLADIHIVNEPFDHKKYRDIFDKLYQELKKIKPTKIVLVGDTLDSFITTSLEAETLAAELLSNLSKLTDNVVVTIGNHEIRKKDLKRKTSIGSIIEIMKTPKITLFDKSGFFDDKTEDIVWVNYSHLEKKILPWKDISHKKDDNKLYVGLFHDPIYGCKLPNNTSMNNKNLVKLSDFDNNDINLLGDIHLRQKLNDKSAYCGSLIQLTFGEKVENHGFLVWNIDKNKNVEIEEHNIPNDYSKITFNINENYDYDNIDFDHSLATEESDFRVIWSDYSSNINNENEEKIKKYIKDKWSKDSVTFEKNRIYTNVASSESLTESINIQDKTVQQNIFKEYLKANKYDDDFIDEILKIDDIIDDRLELTTKINNVEWSIDKLWVDNFKSYEKFEIDWSNVNGIIQLNGENKQGKTTILDAITYITHGTTLSTNKLGGAQREKHGDNRYINNKRELNYCSGGMVIDVNGEKITLLRKTERTLKKDKSISGVSTNIDYYEGIEINDDNKMRGERKTDTQKMLNSIIGDFEDFIRLTLTNSENLNYLISLDRAKFIDSVIRDAGFDIFEKKLAEFKKYKDTLKIKRIDINLNDAEEEVKGLKILLKTYKSEYDDVKKEISELSQKIKDIHVKRDVELKKLHKIDSEITEINVENTKNKIEEYKDAIVINHNKQKSNTIKLKSLKKEYDKETYERLLKDINIINDDVLNLKLKIGQSDSKIEKEKTNIIRVNDKIKQLKQKEIDNQKSKLLVINNEIDKINNEMIVDIEKIERNIKDKKKTADFNVKTLSTELKNIKEKGIDKQKQIKELENSDECPVCGASPEHQKNTKNKINELKNELSELLKNGKIAKQKLTDSKIIVENFQKELDNLENSDDIVEIRKKVEEKLSLKKSEIELINNICEEIVDNDFTNTPELEININKGLQLKVKSEEEIKELESNIKTIKVKIKEKGIEKDNKQSEIYDIEQIKEEVKTYERLVQDNKELSLKIDNIKLTIENAKSKIDKYYDQIKYIEENEKINIDINVLDDEISIVEDDKTNANERLSEIMKEASVTKDAIKDIQAKIKKYLIQVKQDEILKEYQKCVHRDGIPSFLLLKSKDLINVELEDMLTNVDFNVYFDDNLNLKMYSKDFPNAIQNLLEGSGAERTFGATALKMALRTINNQSRPNIFLMDEVMLKLKGDMVQKFNDMLITMKNKIDKIIIIEHVHQVPFDILIDVTKNKKGISHLTIS